MNIPRSGVHIARRWCPTHSSLTRMKNSIPLSRSRFSPLFLRHQAPYSSLIMIKQRQRYVVAFVCFVIFLNLLYSELRHHNRGLHMPTYVKHKARDPSVKLHFPASFPREISKRDLIKGSPAFRASGLRYSLIAKAKKPADTLRLSKRRWAKLVLRIFGSAAKIALDLSRCGETLVSNSTVAVSPKLNLNTDLTKLVARIIREIDRGRDPYLREFKPYLDPHIRLQVEFDVVEKHWFNMAGSLVFLKEYGYHMMVSRLAYSPDGLRNNPKFSFVYLQLYDTNWNEVNDVALVVPTNNVADDRFFTAGGRTYALAHYPSILHVPFYHDYEEDEMKYLGPEDARVVLVQNEAGHEEPLLIYNCQHQKQILLDDDEDDFILKQMSFFRSMFVSWPWQFQRGKFALEDYPNEHFDGQLYNRVKELVIKNSKREKTQKNWTPFVSAESRAESGFDKHLFFVYRWAHLQILKCDFTSENGKCGFAYTTAENMKVTSKIGPLRGGTPLVSVNSVINANNEIALSEIMPENREIWVGFARAHLYKCGCGKDFYRPNLVVLIRDSGGAGEAQYRLSHISGFTSLDVDVIPWDPARPLDICQGTNAIIPNGISAWQAHHIRSSAGGWKIDDLFSLLLSVSDCTVDIVHIHGLLDSLVNMSDQMLFLPHKDSGEDPKKALDRLKATNAKGTPPSNDNIVCAMEESSKFCSVYGMNVEYRRTLASIYEEEYEYTEEDEKLDLYRFAVDEMGTV